jgi:hypothetical protein
MMAPPRDERRLGRATGLRKASTRIWNTGFQIQLALLALERWDRLSADEQARFRQLAAEAGTLDRVREKELLRMWKRLEVRKLLREALGMAARGDAG